MSPLKSSTLPWGSPYSGSRTLGFRGPAFRVYNDWLAEYCAYSPKRLAGLALISLFNIDDAIHDLRRCAKAGLKGAMVWCSPPGDRPYSSPMYDPFWAEAQELSMPISLHSVTGVGPESPVPNGRSRGTMGGTRPLCPMRYSDPLTTLIFSGVLERFPKSEICIGRERSGLAPFPSPEAGPETRKSTTMCTLLPLG